MLFRGSLFKETDNRFFWDPKFAPYVKTSDFSGTNKRIGAVSSYA